MGLWRDVEEPCALMEPKPIQAGFGLVGPEFPNVRHIHTRILRGGIASLYTRANSTNFYKIQNIYF